MPKAIRTATIGRSLITSPIWAAWFGGGLLIMNEPVQGALFLTLLLMAALMAAALYELCSPCRIETSRRGA